MKDDMLVEKITSDPQRTQRKMKKKKPFLLLGVSTDTRLKHTIRRF